MSTRHLARYPLEMATAADSMHPTGMHSCFLYYHLLMKFAKVMFLHVSVILFTRGGFSRPIPRGEVRGSSQRGSPGPYPRGSWWVWLGGSPGPYPGGRLGSLAGGSPGPYPRGVSRPRPGVCMCVSQHALRLTPPPPPTDSYCCGQYASYWNAFLLYLL